MHKTVTNLIQIHSEIKEKINELKYKNYNPVVVAVSKTFNIKHISHLIDFGHLHYGENKVQEALQKWTVPKQENSLIKLHMVGKLQTNKVKNAVKIFDYIHSVDNIKLAKKIALENINQKKNVKIFIQVNLANEEQKSGISSSKVLELVNLCKSINLDVMGLMCLPPLDEEPSIHFCILRELANKYKLNDLSMGMSMDYEKAIKFGSTYLRIGTSFFGKRN